MTFLLPPGIKGLNLDFFLWKPFVYNFCCLFCAVLPHEKKPLQNIVKITFYVLYFLKYVLFEWPLDKLQNMAWDGFACCRQETETNRPLQADHFSHRRSSLFDSLRALLQTDYEKRQISFVYIEKNYYCVTQQNLLCLDISIFLPCH